jgi:hypothetical protein
MHIIRYVWTNNRDIAYCVLPTFTTYSEELAQTHGRTVSVIFLMTLYKTELFIFQRKENDMPLE